jgi:WD40 repeat protein
VKFPSLCFVALGLCITFGAAPLFAGVPGEFKETGSMVVGRSGTATLLPSGHVLVAGGTTAELYDPGSGTWSPTGSLNEVRGGHRATLLPNGKILVVGGLSGTLGFPHASGAELYDPSTGIWTATTAYKPGSGHTATLLPNGNVLVAGGYYPSDGYGPTLYFDAAALYDPASATWTATGRLTAKRASHTATLLPNGKVLVAGGEDTGGPGPPVQASAELYDPATGTWSPTGNLAHPRFAHTATLLHSGKVLVAGGYGQYNPVTYIDTAELYDPSTGTWTETGSLIGGRVGHTATLLASNRVLVTGGRNGNGALATAEIYDPATGHWSSTGNLRQPHSGQTATLLPDNRVLIAGGGTNDSRGAELYTEPPTGPSLLNISTRLRVQTGDNAMIGGFIITGTQTKTVIVRGIGPSLGMSGALQDPVIEVHGSAGELLATNDNWREAGTRQEIIDSGLAPANDAESALWGVINPGTYTVVVRGKDNANGIGLFEVYDLDQTADAALGNVSTRGLAQTNDDVMVGGIIVGGGTEGASTKVLVRAMGPSLPLNGALADPTLELRDASGTLVVFNDNWKTRADGTSQQAEIEATMIAPSNDLESAAVQTLGPGQYTALVRGRENTTGIGLVEVFNLR